MRIPHETVNTINVETTIMLSKERQINKSKRRKRRNRTILADDKQPSTPTIQKTQQEQTPTTTYHDHQRLRIKKNKPTNGTFEQNKRRITSRRGDHIIQHYFLQNDNRQYRLRKATRGRARRNNNTRRTKQPQSTNPHRTN